MADLRQVSLQWAGAEGTESRNRITWTPVTGLRRLNGSLLQNVSSKSQMSARCAHQCCSCLRREASRPGGTGHSGLRAKPALMSYSVRRAHRERIFVNGPVGQPSQGLSALVRRSAAKTSPENSSRHTPYAACFRAAVIKMSQAKTFVVRYGLGELAVCPGQRLPAVIVRQL